MVDPGKVKSIKKKDKALPKEFQINQNNLNDRTVLWDVVPLRHLKQQATTVTIKKIPDTALQETQNDVNRHRSGNSREYWSLFSMPRRNWKEKQRGIDTVIPSGLVVGKPFSKSPSWQADGVHATKLNTPHLEAPLPTPLTVWGNFELPPSSIETMICENFPITSHQNFASAVLLQCGIAEIMFST